MFGSNLYWLFKPCKQFFSIFHTPLQKNNGPSLLHVTGAKHRDERVQLAIGFDFAQFPLAEKVARGLPTNNRAK